MGNERLASVVELLSKRPGHERVRALLHELCAVGLGLPDDAVNFEVPIPEVRGRLDAIFGATIFELKRDLRKELSEAERQLQRYLGEREHATGQRFLGVATDGASFVAYQLNHGRLVRLEEHIPEVSDPRRFLSWLDTAITVRADLMPDPQTMRAEFGRESLVLRRSMIELQEFWTTAHSIPEAALKYDLWKRHLEFVYGTLVAPDDLFLQHTYLTIVAKTMAIRILVTGHVPAGELLAGTPFVNIGLNGAIETDFFDWILLVPGGGHLVDRISRQVGRFRLSDIEVDVLKALYESLIDPSQRHYLGEYYTPDWLAEKMCCEAVHDPINTRVLDPACGSGTFLFHAVRRYLAAAESAQMPLQDALEKCTDRVIGLDVHPVAVLFARVTYLLAIGPQRLRQRQIGLFIPVYLGDALQWDVRQFLTEEEIEVAVPGEPPLRFPGAVASNPLLLELVLRTMREFGDEGASVRAFKSWMNAHVTLPDADRKILAESYQHMRALHQAGRNHIWTYIIRNLTRPLWLSLQKAKPDILIGNPPWLRYNAMSSGLQQKFREASRQRGLWVGGKVATHQDLSAYFFVRCVERYLASGGRVALVMPLACLSRAQYRGFRSCSYVDTDGNVAAALRIDQVWSFSSDVQPLFPVPAAVIFGQRTAQAEPLPAAIVSFRGSLPRRDATGDEANACLNKVMQPWPPMVTKQHSSAYAKRFGQGATIVPRRLFVVQRVEVGRFGGDGAAPLVASRVSALDKVPWNSVQPLRGQIERRFLRPVYLGESIAPFRILSPLTGIIAWDERRKSILNAANAREAGHTHLARWLRQAERLWNELGPGNLSFTQQIDYFGKLSRQFPINRIRVVYAKAGTQPAAAIIEDDRAVIDHKLYWMGTNDIAEARYLIAILNSEEIRTRVEALQSEGQFGPRDFDKVIFSLPIETYSPRKSLHKDLVKAAAHAEQVANAVMLDQGSSFKSARKAVRAALAADGISSRIDSLVKMLVDVN